MPDKVVVEHNFVSAIFSDRLDKPIEKIKQGDKSGGHDLKVK